MIPLIEERDWESLKCVIEGLFKYDQSIKRAFLLRNERMKMNLSTALNLSLASNPPYEIVKSILEIEPELSSILVLMPDIVGDFPIQIACKTCLRANVLKLLLQLDKNKTTFFLVDSNNRNPLYYATYDALCRYRNLDDEPVLDFNYKVSARHHAFPQQHQGVQQQHHHDETKDNSLLTPGIPSKKSYQESINLIKYICAHAPTSIYLNNSVAGVNAINLARSVKSKTKRIRHQLLRNKEGKLYCKRVVYVYKILRSVSKRVKIATSYYKSRSGDDDDDDQRSECAQCGSSTAWSIQLLEENIITNAEAVTFVYQSRKEII